MNNDYVTTLSIRTTPSRSQCNHPTRHLNPKETNIKHPLTIKHPNHTDIIENFLQWSSTIHTKLLLDTTNKGKG